MKRNLSILLIVLLPLLVVSQQIATRTFTTNEGLPSNKVNCLFQDRIGRLWVGTDAGIGIYDGLKFEIVNRKDGLPSNDVRSIIQDNKGTIWIACYDGGLVSYDGLAFSTISKQQGFHSNAFRRLFYSKTFNTLFIGTDDGFYTLKDGKVSFYGKSNGKLSDEHEILWFMEGKGFVYVFPFQDYVIKFYPQTGQCRNLKDADASQVKWNSITSAFVTSNKDTIWGNSFAVSTRSGIKKLNFNTSGLVFNLCEDNDGNIWFPLWWSVSGGIVKYDGNSVTDQSIALGLKNIKCTSVLFDKISGQLWIGTDGNGLQAVPKQIFTNIEIKPEFQSTEKPLKLFSHKGKLYILYKTGIVEFSGQSQTQVTSVKILGQTEAATLIQHIRSLWGKPAAKDINSKPNELWRLPEFYDITFDEQNQPWLSTSVGFFRLSDDLKKVTKSLIVNIRYGTLGFDSAGTLFNWGYWSPTLTVIRSPEQQKSYSPAGQFSKSNTNLPKEISRMLPVGQKMMFSSLYGGLYLADGKSFTYLNESCPELPDNISDICLTPRGGIAYCTNTGEAGIGRLNQGKFEILYKLDILDESFGRNFMWATSDRQNNIYIGTNRGLLLLNNPEVFSDKARDVRFFSVPEGYNDCNVHSPVIDSAGNIWLVSAKSLVCVDSKSISTRSQSQPKLSLSSLETTDSTYRFPRGQVSKESNVLEKLTFPYSSKNLTFHFRNINLLNPEKDRFLVQLEGFDKEFKDIGNQQTVEYTNLPAGNYKFVVRVVNTNTLVRQEKTLLEFTIKPPYWQTWWFLTVVGILLIALVNGLFKLRTTQIRKDAQTKLDMAELEMQALQSQMNPHFFFNVMNSLQRYILERDTDKGLGLLGDINSMVRQTFTLASKKAISLKEEVSYLDSYLKLEQVRSGHKFQYEISIDPELSQNEPVIPPMLIQPMVENAVKHGLMPLDGNDGQLQISFTHQEKHSLCCTITDNGIGIQNSLDSKRDSNTRLSKALNITQRRIELLKRNNKAADYSLTIVDRSSGDPSEKGTKVTIMLPLE